MSWQGDPCRDQAAAQVAALAVGPSPLYEWQWIPPADRPDLRPGPVRRGDAGALLDPKNLAWLKRLNALGHGVYVRPAPPGHDTAAPLVFVDDLTAEACTRVRRDGHRWAVLVESSPGSFHGWLRLADEPLPRAVVTEAARRLASAYGGDPRSADWRHYGRLAGFTNTKRRHHRPHGPPYCRLVAVWHGVTEAAARLLDAVRDALSPRRAAAAARVMPAPRAGIVSTTSTRPGAVSSGMFAAAWHGARTTDPTPSARDCAAAIRLLARGVPPDAVQAALLAESPDLAARHRDPLDYARRTVAAAQRWVAAQSRGDDDEEVSVPGPRF